MPRATAAAFNVWRAAWDSLVQDKPAVMKDGTITMAARSQSPFMAVERSGPPLFFKILRQLGITVEEFQKLR